MALFSLSPSRNMVAGIKKYDLLPASSYSAQSSLCDLPHIPLIFFHSLWNKCTQKNEMSLPLNGLVITQPDILLMVKFDYVNS